MAFTKPTLHTADDILNEAFNEATGKLDVEGASGGSSGTQYADGATAATPTGTAVVWNDSGTARVASAAKPLPVSTASLTAALDTVTVVQDSNSTAALSQVTSTTSSQVILAANTAQRSPDLQQLNRQPVLSLHRHRLDVRLHGYSVSQGSVVG